MDEMTSGGGYRRASYNVPHVRQPRKVAEFVGEVLAEPKMSAGLGGRRVALIWRDTVGPDVAAHTVPEAIRGGVLHVVVDDPVRAHNYSACLRRELIARINDKLDGRPVRDVRFRTGALPTAGE